MAAKEAVETDVAKKAAATQTQTTTDPLAAEEAVETDVATTQTQTTTDPLKANMRFIGAFFVATIPHIERTIS